MINVQNPHNSSRKTKNNEYPELSTQAQKCNDIYPDHGHWISPPSRHMVHMDWVHILWICTVHRELSCNVIFLVGTNIQLKYLLWEVFGLNRLLPERKQRWGTIPVYRIHIDPVVT